MWVGRQTLFRKRLSALILDQSEFSQNSCQSQGSSNGRCPWICDSAPYARSFARNSCGCRCCIYKRGFCTLPSDFDRAMREASVGRTATDTDSHAFLHTNIRTGRRPDQKPQSDIMTLLKHLNNEKSAHVETTAMQYPTSQPVHTSPILGSLKHPIIRSALLLILLLFSSFSALAYDCEVAGIYYNLNTTDKTASVTKGKYNGDVTIPETIAYNNTTIQRIPSLPSAKTLSTTAPASLL